MKRKGFTLAEVSMSKRTSGIKNEVLNSRESETKEPSENIIKRCAFTLAEVLITLAIIGIVAALTIPTVVSNYNKKALYTQFMKTYNTLQTIMQLASIEEGSPGVWNYTRDRGFIDKYIAPYAKNQGHVDNYLPEGATVKSLSGDMEAPAAVFIASYSMPGFLILDDGAAISLTGRGSKHVDIFVDINGAKGPNTVGRDMFSFNYGFNNYDNVNKPEIGLFAYNSNSIEQFCDVNGSSSGERIQGQTCAVRLIKEGKMDY